MRVLARIALCILPLTFATLHYNMYWRWRDCFNEEGRCFDPVSGAVYHAQSGLIYGSLLTVSVLIWALGLWFLGGSRKK